MQKPSVFKSDTNKWTRNGVVIKDADGKVVKISKTLRKAKRYMRTGSEERR